jgi:predicted alpha/beta-fold hydrolase
MYRQQPLFQGGSDIIASPMPGILMMKILNLKHKPDNNACAERFQAATRQVLLHHAGFSFGGQLLCLLLSSIMATASRSFRYDCNSSS